MIGAHVFPGHAWIITSEAQSCDQNNSWLLSALVAPNIPLLFLGEYPVSSSLLAGDVTLISYFTLEMQVPNRTKLGFLPSPFSAAMFISLLKICFPGEVVGSPQLLRLTALCRRPQHAGIRRPQPKEA